MKSISLFILIGLISVSAFSQHTNSIFIKALEAEKLYRNKKYSEAVSIYKDVLHSGINDASAHLDAISAAAMAGDTISLISFLEMGVRVGLTREDYQRLWPILTKDMDQADILSQCNFDFSREIYLNSLDSALLKQLQHLENLDQEFRGDIMDEELFEKYQPANDRKVWNELRSIVDERGTLPDFSGIGMNGLDQIELFIHHMDKATLQWILPYIIERTNSNQYNLGAAFLYQFDRIGMSEGVILGIDDKLEFFEVAERTTMKNGLDCQAYGEWFYERSMSDNKLYFTPIDPSLSISEVNRLRNMLQLDDIESKLERTPWVSVVNIPEFERLIVH